MTLIVKKLRGLKAYKGPHSAALMSLDDLELPEHRLISEATLQSQGNKIPYLTVGLNVFPDISVFKDLPRKKEPPVSEVISTGTIGLDDLLPLSSKEGKGFERGETILLVGSAGSGKTLLALNFMRDGYIGKQRKAENTIWLNFEGDLGTLKFATRGFEEPHKGNFEKMLKLGENKETGSIFEFIDFPPINLDLNKIVFTLEAICSNYGRIDRLVIDSITELEKAKGGGQPAVKVFLTGLIQFLRDRGITTIFVCRSDAFFKSIDKIEEQISSLVDLIICIRNFDVHNEIHKGIYIQKARGREHHSKIIRMSIDSIEGIMIEDSGWDIENLLAGDTSNIDTPRIFFKLFYENPAEETINKKIIKDFDDDRYPGVEPKFTLVKKPSVYTEFWSFRGQFSAGHANTRVLSIADHVLSAFRDNNRLLELDKYVKSELLQIIATEAHLKRLYPTPKESSEMEFDLRNIDAIPCYRDFGVMVFKELSTFERLLNQETSSKQFLQGLSNFLEKIKKERLKNQPEMGEDDNKWEKAKYTWDELLVQFGNINKQKGNKNYNIVPFAFPPLDNKAEFVAFFMELLWSHGGDIYEIEIREKYITSGYEGKFKKAIKESVLKEFLCYYKKLYQKITEKNGTGSEKSQNKNVISAFNEINPTAQSLSKKFEQRFEIYGLKLKKIDIQEFKDWILKKLEDSDWINDEDIESKIKKDSALKLDDKPFKETIKLMLRLVHQGGVINPIEGEFRHRALLSRNWYSRISQPGKEQCNRCIDPQQENCPNFSKSNKDKCRREYLSLYRQGKYSLLPLPLAAIKLDDQGEMKYFRSVTCLTYWSLVMLKNALSPEIGGNFIESINAPDYYESRLSDRSGMPVANWEVKKEKFRQFDPNAYSILGRILNNGLKNVKALEKIGQHLEKTKDKPADRDKYEVLEQIFKNENAFVRREFLEVFENKKHLKRYLDENKKEINERAFYHKVRQTRIAFYQLEQTLHYQLRQLFIPDHNFREKRLYEDDIYREAKILCDEEWELKSKELKEDAQKKIENIEEKWEKYLDKIKDEFRLHVIFELLTYFFHDYMTGAGD